MLNLAGILDGIIAELEGNLYINSVLNGNIFYAIVPQQNDSTGTFTPYCSIVTVGSSAQGQFGGTYLDKVLLQITVWTTNMPLTSNLLEAIGELLNDASSVILDEYQLVNLKRASSVRITVPGQDQNQNYIYQGTVDFLATTSGC